MNRAARPRSLRWAATAVAWIIACFSATVAMAEAPEAGRDVGAAAEFWSFRLPRVQTRPSVRNARWVKQPLDFFVLARIERRGLTPSPPADRRALIRRVTFDLTGLPPTPSEVEDFVADASPDAYERVVDRLLALPAYGERIASLWLPLARYAEDQAQQVGNDTQFFYPYAYKYRAWVIDAFNRDLPYDRFIIDQLVADQAAEAEPRDLAALGFIGLGPKYYNRDRVDVQASEWEDRVDVVTRTFLGLTVACARCHDHKFDPITQRDYYALAGVFACTKMVNQTADGKVLEGNVQADKMPPDTLHIVHDGSPQDLNIFLRGDPERKGAPAPRSFLRVLCGGDPRPFAEGSGRKELAEAIASPANPLTARVMVNRVWGMLTGRPIVPTPSNFGHSGMAPTNQPLLDDLAMRFVDKGWSVKSLVREIVLSATYRQCSAEDTSRAAVDPGNESLWRMDRRRLTVEQWRDATLMVCGELQAGGGKSMEADDPKNLGRTVYSRVSRLKLNDFLMQFDYPDANLHAEKRAVTTTPIQKLFLMNSRFMQDRSAALAARLTAGPVESDESRVARAYRLLFGRDPQNEEVDLAIAYLREPESAGMSRWQAYAQVLLASDEMFYVD